MGKFGLKYNNSLNEMNFSILTETQMNILFAIFQQLAQDNKEIASGGEPKEMMVFMPLNEFFDLAEVSTRNKDFKNEVLDKIGILQSFKFRYDLDSERTRQEVIFPLCEFNQNSNYVAVQASIEFVKRYIISEFNGYTKYDFKELAYLAGTYNKTIYRCLKQWRTQGKWEISYDKFKELLGIPESYQACNIDQRIIQPALKALTEPLNLFEKTRIPFENLKCEKIKNGRKIEKLIFTFKPQGQKAQENEQKALEYKQNAETKTQDFTHNQIAQIAQNKTLRGSEMALGMLKRKFLNKSFWSGKGAEKASCKIIDIYITQNPSTPQENYTIKAKNVESGKTFEMKFSGHDHIENTLKPYYD